MKVARLSFFVACGGALASLQGGCSDDSAQGASNQGANSQGAENQGATNQGAANQGGANPGGNGGTGGSGGDTATGGGGGSCDCTGKACGPDGCGGVCGTCDDGDSCDVQTGTCLGFCGNSCEGSCGPCPSNTNASLTCTQSGICKCNATCTPSCAGKDCGDDGCGGSCGPCDAGSVCAFTTGAPTPWTCQTFAGTDPQMSFFVTSRGTYDQGGNLGGLAGGDAICTQLANEVGVVGRTWRAYLSTAGNAARDRIGTGPWRNARGEAIVDVGCSDCIAELHASGIAPDKALTEIGTQVDWSNAHDILTGSNADGTPSATDCNGWTSNSENVSATVGHSNEQNNWVSAHTTGCDRVGMQCTAGQGHLYCFAL